jgi:GNAT superfamily N-acetyltransferase
VPNFPTAYSVIPYDPGLKQQIADLQRHLWSGDADANMAYLEWKYERNPYWANPLIYLATSGGRVVGMRGMFGSEWEIGTGGEPFAIPCADDFVIAPDHRNHGVSSLIGRAALDDLARRGHRYVFSLSPGPVTLVTSLLSGWRRVGAMRPLWHRRPADLVRRSRARLSRTPVLWRLADPLRRLGALRPLFRRLDQLGQHPRRGRSGEIRLEREPRAGAMADLVRRLGHDGRIRQVRDERYLAWRFQNPLHEYRFLCCGGDRLEGYLVLQAYRPDRSRGVNIVDWEGTTDRVRADLLRAAVEWGNFEQLSIWTATLSDEALGQLAAAAFVPPVAGSWLRSPNVLVFATREAARDQEPTLGGRRLLDVAEWDMRMVYSMAG